MSVSVPPVGDPLDRAFVAYYRIEGARAAQPSTDSFIQCRDGKRYVVLVDVNGRMLAVYRILNGGPLKRLRRWPTGLF